MPTPFESAQLILKLYDLRREPVMRTARHWFLREFHPESIADVHAAMASEHNPYLRMVVGYWDMAASLVSHGAIDRQMFIDASGEMFATFSKIYLLLDEIRAALGQAGFLQHMEEVVRSAPGIDERLPQLRARFVAAPKAS